ncbi:DNA polymerase bacteriophage-type,uracil-DNA glycosylase superfamily protein [Cupriavidus basilensis OR16]|uniref:Type-4 uracil-DNA glycosylase n=1 Tax=Cupriavidus basilensis OR16 TaxID=1127483 RepID=H1SD87_9BURK|nr:uracil-DNA glycosylase [Cupriavidus basilensis]EHP39535.1 DNA polymerase bacteriophage-type,uracil-DNA glycosylase superfamily protein [Cupriavidus basilensis OR16]
MSRRARFLEVLGIADEWVLRRAPLLPEAVEPSAVAALAEASADDAAVIEDTASREVAQAAMAEASVEAAWAEVAPDAGSLQTDMEPAAPAQPEVAVARIPAEPVLADTDAREAVIARLEWAALEQRVRGCTDCQLCHGRTQTVFGVGDRQAEWMLVGEAPGENEDLQGEPFVGQAGKLLDNMLAAVGLARGRNVFIANVLKCRPPGNRNPEPEEVAQCEPYLRRQIALIQPKLIVVLGRFAAQSLLRTTTPIGKLRGTVHSYEGIPVVVTYHPAYLLRTLSDKARAWEDLCLAREVHARAGAKA